MQNPSPVRQGTLPLGAEMTTGVGGQFEYTTRGLMLAPGAATTITIEDEDSAHQRAVTVWPVGTGGTRLTSMTRKTRRSQRGISLLEVLVAITLFALTSSGLAAFLVQSLRRTAGTGRRRGPSSRRSTRSRTSARSTYPAIVSRSYATTITGKSYGVGTVVQNDTPASGMKGRSR